jgi:hypothetical protein
VRARPTEVKALVPLLTQDWETPEELASALIGALDASRASRVTYIGVAEYPCGNGERAWYSAVGPYPGKKSAERALSGDPAASLARALVVVPLTSSEGLRERLKALDAKPAKGE